MIVTTHAKPETDYVRRIKAIVAAGLDRDDTPTPRPRPAPAPKPKKKAAALADVGKPEGMPKTCRRAAAVHKPGPKAPRTISRAHQEKMAQGRRRLVERGWVVGGVTPFGYRRAHVNAEGTTRAVLVPDEETGPFVAEIFREYLRGRTLGELSRWAESRMPDRKWSKAKVRWILSNKVYLGLLCYGAVPTLRGRHEPLVTLAAFQAVDELLKKARRS